MRKSWGKFIAKSRVEIQSPLVNSVPWYMTGCTRGGNILGVLPKTLAFFWEEGSSLRLE